MMPVKRFRPGYLREAIDSVLRQTSPAWRLIVVTERGQLRELGGLLAAALRDPRINLVANEGRKLAGAFNTAMRRAETPFVAILLGDDRWEPNAVAVLQRRIAASPAPDFIHSSRRYVDDQGRPISGVLTGPESVSLEDFATRTPVKHLLCWRTELALSFGGMDESIEWAPDDFDFPWCMAEHGARFATVPECLYVYRDHRSCYRLTTHVPRSVQITQIERVLRKHGLDRAAIRERITSAQRTHLRQALYASPLDRALRRLRRIEAPAWFESYD